MKRKLENLYNSGFSSSPIVLTEKDLNIILENSCQCCYCNKNIFEMNDFPDIKERDLICEECYSEHYRITCPICEDSFENPEGPEETRFVLSKSIVKEERMDLKPGLYQVKKFPFYYGNILSGFEGVFNDALELCRELDINSMMKRIHKSQEPISADYICPDCFDYLQGKTRINNNYIDRIYGIHRVITERGVIANGF